MRLENIYHKKLLDPKLTKIVGWKEKEEARNSRRKTKIAYVGHYIKPHMSTYLIVTRIITQSNKYFCNI